MTDSWADHLNPATPDPDLEPDAVEALDSIRSRLAAAETWDGPSSSARDRLLAAAEADPPEISTAPRLARPRQGQRRWLVPVAGLSIAAAVAAVALVGLPDRNVTEFTLAGGPHAPDAEVVAEVEPLAAGIAIILDIRKVPGAEPGTYYAAWLVGDQGPVPIGTFHWREGGIPIELWSGVDTAEYPNLVVTLQNEGDPPIPSETVAFRGYVGP